MPPTKNSGQPARGIRMDTKKKSSNRNVSQQDAEGVVAASDA